MFRADRLRRRKFKFGAHLGNKRLQRVTVFRLVLIDFVDHQNHRRVLGQLFQHDAVGIGKTHRFHDENHHIHTAECLGNVLVQTVVERVAVVGLKTRRIDKHELRGIVGINPRYAVARRLRLFAGNTDFLTDEMVHQR
ncbi:Uncharacterised protein [Neisseria meningitidis]|nr:Uncharacterised protein [Neisseria meningitidis]